MRKIISSVWLGLSCATLGSTAQEDCEVLPMLDSGFVPGGAAHDGEALWVAEFLKYNIHRVDPVTGEILATIPSPARYTLGLAWDGEALWAAGEQKAMIYRLDPSDGTVLHSFKAPTFGQSNPDGSGLAWDGATLWHADYFMSKLRQLDPLDGSVLAELSSPGPMPLGLTMVGEYLLVADGMSDDLTLVDTTDGSVVSVCPAPDPDVRGAALGVDGEVFVGGWGTLGIHRVQLPGAQEPWSETICDGSVNSMGEVAHIVPEGDPSVAAQDLRLTVGPVPDDFVLVATSPHRVDRPFRGTGTMLCIGKPMRLVGVGRALGGEVTFDLFRRHRLAMKLQPGQTWVFQSLYRDRSMKCWPRVGLSDAITISFEP